MLFVSTNECRSSPLESRGVGVTRKLPTWKSFPGVLTGIITDRPDQVTTAIIVQGPFDDVAWSGPDAGMRLRAYANEFAEMRLRQPGQGGVGPMSLRSPPERAMLAGQPALLLCLQTTRRPRSPREPRVLGRHGALDGARRSFVRRAPAGA